MGTSEPPKPEGQITYPARAGFVPMTLDQARAGGPVPPPPFTEARGSGLHGGGPARTPPQKTRAA